MDVPGQLCEFRRIGIVKRAGLIAGAGGVADGEAVGGVAVPQSRGRGRPPKRGRGRGRGRGRSAGLV